MHLGLLGQRLLELSSALTHGVIYDPYSGLCQTMMWNCASLVRYLYTTAPPSWKKKGKETSELTTKAFSYHDKAQVILGSLDKSARVHDRCQFVAQRKTGKTEARVQLIWLAWKSGLRRARDAFSRRVSICCRKSADFIYAAENRHHSSATFRNKLSWRLLPQN